MSIISLKMGKESPQTLLNTQHMSGSELCVVIVSCIFKLFFNIHLFLRHSEREERAEREGDRIRSGLQALSCQHRAWHGARAHELRYHDLSWSQRSTDWAPRAPRFHAFFGNNTGYLNSSFQQPPRTPGGAHSYPSHRDQETDLM